MDYLHIIAYLGDPVFWFYLPSLVHINLHLTLQAPKLGRHKDKKHT